MHRSFDVEQAKHRVEKVVMGDALAGILLQAGDVELLNGDKILREPIEPRYLLLLVRCNRIGQSMQIDTFLAQRLSMV